MDVHISSIEYVLPERSTSVEALGSVGRLVSPSDVLRSFGFERAWIADGTAGDLALRAARSLLERTGYDPESIDLVLYAGAAPGSHATGESLLGGFSYPAASIQYELGLVKARVIGISQVGCLGLMTAVSVARRFLLADSSLRRVLCVSADVLPRGSRREILFNLISDGACAVIVESGPGPNRIVTERYVTKGYYWDCDARANEIVASYFPTARAIILDTLADPAALGRPPAWIIPHNVSRRSWEILLQLANLSADHLYADNIAAKGHIIGGDNFINLKDAEGEGRLKAGDRLLLFNFGFGASWATMVLEH